LVTKRLTNCNWWGFRKIFNVVDIINSSFRQE
jgi:hypothetical protein